MDEPEKVAYCAPGLEIPARFALIEHARDVGDSVAEIRQTQFVKPGDVIVMDMAAMRKALDRPVAFEVTPRWPVRMEYALGAMVNRPMPLVNLSGI